MRWRGIVLIYGYADPLCLEASYARAFRELGWDVQLFDANARGGDLSWWIKSRVGRRLTRHSLRLRRRAARQRNEALIQRTRELGPEVLLLVNGELIMPETVRAVKKLTGSVAVLHPDAPVPGNASHRPEHWPVLQEVDTCFIWSRQLGARLLGAGAKRVIYLPFGWDHEVFPRMESSRRESPQVVFVGGWDRHRERWLEPVAERFELEIWGPGYWGTRTRMGSALRRCWRGRALRGREAAEVIAAADVALNIVRRQNLPDGTNMRTFEIPGAGGFQLATRTSGATEIYPEHEAGAYFASVDEMLERIEYYLANEGERRFLSECAHAITEREHRYVHRARRILSVLEGTTR